MTGSDTPLNYAFAPLSSLSLYGNRVTGSVVGRPAEMAAAEQELAAARRGMACIAAEGEPGIGKTRFLLAVEELAGVNGFAAIAVTADEEIRGPFLLARSIFGSAGALEAVEGSRAKEPLRRAVDALSNRSAAGLETLPRDQKLLRVFDLAAVALRTLAAEKPLAILIDDLQWADEDSLLLLRYVVRVDAASPILFVVASRGDEVAFVNEAVTLLADMERMGILRRLKFARFRQPESTEFLQQVLGAPINLSSAAIMHAQAEGVPFVLAEQAHAYRDAGLIQQIDGVWTLARNAERLLPSAVQTLIRRRGARLPEATKTAMSEAAVLGRSFSLRDLREVKLRLKDDAQDVDSLAEALAPAVAAGMLVQHPVGSAADYAFTHEQIREYAASTLTLQRRRAIHAAIVEMLTADGEPPTASLPLIAQHAGASGQGELCARASIEAARAALEVNAPEEVLRLVDLAHAVASTPQDRVALLCLQDDALGMLRRSTQRLQGLAELAALADALGDSHLELDVMLRRAAALRLSEEPERAAELAGRVRALAAERGDTMAELTACLELGQDLLRTEIGEGYVQNPTEGDLDGAEEAYDRAAALAEGINDEAAIAGAHRELGMIAVSRIRLWYVELVQAGGHIDILRRVVAGEALETILPDTPAAPLAINADAHFRRALEVYEKLGNRRGVMSTIIAMAYAVWGPEIHVNGSPKRIEEIRRLMMRMKSLTKESERALAEAQMLFGAHIYARAKVFPDMAIDKGQEAYAAAQTLGERPLEFAIAGSTAMAHADIGDLAEADRWLGVAATIASTEPTAFRARQIESWRGSVQAAAGDAAGMREHLERAVRLAADQGRPAARCKALAQLALEAARLGAEQNDEALLAVAERAAGEAQTLTPLLPGHPPWAAEATAALARIAIARHQPEAAVEAGRATLASLKAAMQEDLNLPILLPAADAVLTYGDEGEAAAVRDQLQLMLGLVAQRMMDEGVRVKWFRTPIGRELTRLGGTVEKGGGTSQAQAATFLASAETALLRLLTEGRTNSEIAAELGTTEEVVARQLAELFVKIGASSRADATAVAMTGGLV